MSARFRVWAGKPLADSPARNGRPAGTGRYAQTFYRERQHRIDAMQIAVSLPDDVAHTLITVDRYDGWDRVTREHKVTRIAERRNGVWLPIVLDVAA